MKILLALIILAQHPELYARQECYMTEEDTPKEICYDPDKNYANEEIVVTGKRLPKNTPALANNAVIPAASNDNSEPYSEDRGENNTPPSVPAVDQGQGGAGSSTADGGQCLSSLGVAQITCTPEQLAKATVPVTFPADEVTCKEIFRSLFSSTNPAAGAASMGTDACKMKTAQGPADIGSIQKYTEQCAAIAVATANMTQFVNPSSGRAQTRQAEEGEDPDQVKKDNQQAKAANAKAEAAVSVNGMACVGRSEYDLDYPACKKFVGWYNALQLSEAGLGAYNQNQQVEAGQKGLQQTAEGQAKGDITGAYDGISTNLSEKAASQDRVMIFNGARAVAIGAQLGTFPNPDNLQGKCSQFAGCCGVLKTMSTASRYFPNAQMKSMMTAEIAKAIASALAAKLAADAARNQKGIVNKIKDSITDPTVADPGLINSFCVQNPQDPRCVVSTGTGGGTAGSFGGNSFTSGDFGSDGIGAVNPLDQGGALDGGTGVGGSDAVGAIGTVDTGANAAKDVFNAPSGASSIGSQTPGGGGGGSAGNASAPGLSKDPGVQGEQKPTDTKVTSLGAGYNGAAYSGGAYRAGGDKKPGDTANPFASLFGKDKDRGPAAVEIDPPTSDLFVKISNRYSEVTKRKDLMEVK